MRLIIVLLFTITINAQSGFFWWWGEGGAGYALSLNGSDEYLYNDSSTDFDFHGAERITMAADRDFEDTTYYTSDFSADTDGWTVTSWGDGDGTLTVSGNDMIVACTTVTNNSVRPILAGPNSLYPSTPTYVKVTIIADSGTIEAAFLGSYDSGISHDFTADSVFEYEGLTTADRTTFSVYFDGTTTFTSTIDSIFVEVYPYWDDNGTHSITVSSDDANDGTYSGELVASGAGDSTTNYISLPAAAFTTLVSGEKYSFQLYARGKTANTHITAQIGGQVETSDTLSTVAGTFTEFSYVFQATAYEPSKAIKLYLDQADTVYIDQVTLTQVKDYSIQLYVNLSSTDNQGFISKYASLNGWWVGVLSSSIYFVHRTSEGGNIASETLSNLGMSTGQWYLITCSYDHTDNMHFYVNGVEGAEYVNQSRGNNNTDEPIEVGLYETSYMNGSIGEIQIFTYTDIAASNFNGSATGFLDFTGGGASKVLLLDYSGDSDAFLDDKSDSGNDFTGVNVTIGDRITGGYK